MSSGVRSRCISRQVYDPPEADKGLRRMIHHQCGKPEDTPVIEYRSDQLRSGILMVISPCRLAFYLDFHSKRRYARRFGGWRNSIGEMNPIPVALQGHTRVRRQSGLITHRISG